MTTLSRTAKAGEVAGALKRDGLALVEGVMTGDQLARAQRGVNWAMENVGGHKLIKYPSYEWGAHPVFVKLIEHPLVLGVCDVVLGADRHLIAAQCSRNVKAGFYAPGAASMHNDAVFFPTIKRKVPGVALEGYSFSAMWYLQDTPLEMGPTQLVIGSHVEYERAYKDEEADGLLASGRLFNRAVPAGSLLLFNNRTWHRGRPNQTDLPRDLITNVYALPAVEKVQLLTSPDGGAMRYVVPEGLLATGSEAVRELLRVRG
jgi:ectoine hydroxylase-related dioxygenase (phytanoyl-CoA dioxygenase family)